MRIAALGDVHGNQQFMARFFQDWVSDMKPDTIVQLGDITLAWKQSKIEQFLDVVAALVNLYDVPFYFIDGNHEDFYVLFEKYMQDNTEGFVEVRDNVFYIPRGFAWEWDGVRFMGFGGAHSVNKSSLTKFINWFPEEDPSFSDIDRAMGRGHVDVMFTHDAPAGIEFINEMYGSAPDAESHANREILFKVAESAQPKLVLHGHHHVAYRELWTPRWGDVHVAGLDADYTHKDISDMIYVVDTQKPVWYTATEQ